VSRWWTTRQRNERTWLQSQAPKTTMYFLHVMQLTQNPGWARHYIKIYMAIARAGNGSSGQSFTLSRCSTKRPGVSFPLDGILRTFKFKKEWYWRQADILESSLEISVLGNSSDETDQDGSLLSDRSYPSFTLNSARSVRLDSEISLICRRNIMTKLKTSPWRLRRWNSWTQGTASPRTYLRISTH
jgi:hypothetical protein